MAQGKAATAQDGRIFLPGTIADRTMRWWLNKDDPKPGEMVEYAPEMFRKIVDPETEEERNDTDRYNVIRWKGDQRQDRRAVLDFVIEVVSSLEPLLMDHVIPYDYEPEKKFTVEMRIPDLNGEQRVIELTGGIDIVVKPDHWELFDLKATKDPQYVKKVLGQGMFYELAWGALVGEPVTRFGFITPACKEKVVWTNISEDDKRVLMTRIIKMAHDIWRGDYSPKVDNAGCRYCEVFHACPKWNGKRDSAGKLRLSLHG